MTASKPYRPYRMILSGGGTGGHIFPAIAIANEFKHRHPDAEILFVGAQGRMEMTRVPEAGYQITGLWISGLQRRLTLSNLLFPVKLLVSYIRAAGIIKKFKPDVVVGTGGYASGPIMMAATRAGIPAVVQEQNSFAGLANKQVASKAALICVAYEGMERYFPKDKILLTGNPVRRDISTSTISKEVALRHFGLEPGRKTVAVFGGSLGARTINESILEGLHKFQDSGVQVIWQTGRQYYDQIRETLEHRDKTGLKVVDFLKEVNMAYAAADLVISRSGALAVSELCIAGVAAILVPSPNVAEDHQYKNAMALVSKGAAVLVKDSEAHSSLVNTALEVLFDEGQCKKLSQQILQLAKPTATEAIVTQIEKLVQ